MSASVSHSQPAPPCTFLCNCAMLENALQVSRPSRVNTSSSPTWIGNASVSSVDTSIGAQHGWSLVHHSLWWTTGDLQWIQGKAAFLYHSNITLENMCHWWKLKGYQLPTCCIRVCAHVEGSAGDVRTVRPFVGVFALLIVILLFAVDVPIARHFPSVHNSGSVLQFGIGTLEFLVQVAQEIPEEMELKRLLISSIQLRPSWPKWSFLSTFQWQSLKWKLDAVMVQKKND